MKTAKARARAAKRKPTLSLSKLQREIMKEQGLDENDLLPKEEQHHRQREAMRQFMEGK